MYFFRTTIVIISFFSLLFYGVMCSENNGLMTQESLDATCNKATTQVETDENLSQSKADNSTPNIDRAKKNNLGGGSETDTPESLSTSNTNSWTIILLIFLSGVLVIKVILSQADVKRLTFLVNRLSSKLDKIDKSTWGKLASTLEKIQSESTSESTTPQPSTQVQNFDSHGFPLTVFAEVERIEARLAKYDENDKNRKPMLRALERLENSLSELGYEREKLVGAKYIEGKNYEARFVPSKDPSHKTPTITRVYKPSIFHEGKLIQRGEIEVSECG